MKWAVAPLSNIVRIVGGGTPSKANRDFWSGEIPWVSPKDMVSRDIWETQDHISENAVAESATQLVPAGSVLIVARSGILARFVPIGIARVPVTLNQDMKAFLPATEALDNQFLAYFLESRSTELLARFVKRGATVHSLDMNKLQQLKVPIAPLLEQRRIVEILDQADTLRKRRAEADDKAERILPSLFNKMFGDPATNPKSWEIMKLSDLVIELRYGSSTRCSAEPNGLPVLRIPNILRGEVDLSDLKYAELPAQEANRLLLQYGDLLFVRTNGNRDYVGRCAIFDLDMPYLFASYLIRARLQQDRVDPWYVGAYLRTPSGRQAMSSFIRTTAGQSNISLEGLRQIPIPLAPLTTQRLFRTHTEHLYWLRQEREKRGNSLETTFSSLLHRAFSGDLTAKWRETHMKELLAEMEEQAKHLAARGTHSQLENAALQESLF